MHCVLTCGIRDFTIESESHVSSVSMRLGVSKLLKLGVATAPSGIQTGMRSYT
jgi:hypothetical protein